MKRLLLTALTLGAFTQVAVAKKNKPTTASDLHFPDESGQPESKVKKQPSNTKDDQILFAESI